MSGTAGIVIGAVVAITAFAAWIYRHTQIKAPIPIATLALVLLLGYGVFTHDRAAATDKAHNDCVSRVERSEGNRAMWVALGDYLGERGNTNAVAILKQLLDKNLPLLELKDCP